MTGPGWLTGLLAAVMLTVAAYNVTRLVAAPRWGRAAELDADGTHMITCSWAPPVSLNTRDHGMAGLGRR